MVQWSHGYACVNDRKFEKLCFGEIEGTCIQAVLKTSCYILLDYTCATIAYDFGPGMHILSILVDHDYTHQYIITLFY